MAAVVALSAIVLSPAAGAVVPLAPAAPADSSQAPGSSSAGAPSGQANRPNEVVWGTRPADNKNGTGRAFFDYALSPGESVSDAVEVENRGQKPLTLQVYAADAFTTSAGTIDLAASGAESVDAGTWVTVGRPTVTIEPNKKVIVPFTVKVPDSAEPGDHPAGLVTSLTSGDGTSGVAVERRLGSRLYVRVPGNLSPSAAVSDVWVHYVGTLNPFGPGRAEVTYQLKNTGNVRITPQETVRIRGLWGLITTTGTAAGKVPDVLPGSTITRTVQVDGVWPLVVMGAAVTVTPTPSEGAIPGLGGPVTADTTGWAVPWPQLAVLVLVVLLIIAWRMAVKQRRGAVQRRIDAAVRATRAEYEEDGS